MKCSSTPAKQLFSLGQIAWTPRALRALSVEGITGAQLLERHQIGDWGDLEESESPGKYTVRGRRVSHSFRLHTVTHQREDLGYYGSGPFFDYFVVARGILTHLLIFIAGDSPKESAPIKPRREITKGSEYL